MKLPPMFTSFVNDAAKALRRISPQEFIEVAVETLTKLLDIPTIIVKMSPCEQAAGRLQQKATKKSIVHPAFGCMG